MDDLRSSLRKARRGLDAGQREEAAVRCAERALEIAEVRRARSIAFYMAHLGEVSCAPLMDWALARGIRTLLPVVVGRHMRFAPYSPGGPLVPNRWGIPEPEWRPRLWTGARHPSVVFVPLVAFDDAGNRLGQGGGYYDRAFAFRRRRNAHWRRPLLAGLAYGFQQVDELPAKPTDVPLDIVITGTGTHDFRR